MGRMSDATKPDGGTVGRFRSIVLPHLDAAYGYARWLTRDPVEAQDLAQEAMLRALRYFHSFRGEEARPWLLRIVRNTWIDLRKRNGPEKLPLEVLETRAAEGPDPEQSALAGDRRRQVAAALDLPIGTVMSRIARAREKLAVELKGRLERRDHGLPDL